MNSTPNTTPTTAAGMYSARYREVAGLIEMARKALEGHRERAAAAPGNWGFAADLGLIREELITVVACLAGEDAAAIKRALPSAG